MHSRQITDGEQIANFVLESTGLDGVKIRNIMSAVFRHGIRHGFLPRDKEANPMSYVRQTAESGAVHAVLTVEQVVRILSHLREPCRTIGLS
jgi:hypothetical protein